jgi:hypothetical protein
VVSVPFSDALLVAKVVLCHFNSTLKFIVLVWVLDPIPTPSVGLDPLHSGESRMNKLLGGKVPHWWSFSTKFPEFLCR